MYLGNMVNAGGRCEAAVTARTRCGWVEPRKCGHLLYGTRFPNKAEMGCSQELCKARNAVWKRSMVYESETGIYKK